MARKKSKKGKSQVSTDLLNNSNYAVKGAKGRRAGKGAMIRANAKQTKAAREAIEKSQRMAKIEAYAKERSITVTQAMIHFM